ncbi:IclR family transcriptional regulator [Streptomyces ficellus]|uniref:IclR family transcriptional regulator n=1 Tax=Streptomyces ficellus TaxID=1977088 RepID=A0A6I6FIW1_9ACTN|nr:IclR family transcriptional regulator [Streptomyces ficellus]QGV80092.1 IclR family transcriptional regulator [Streptomyces ficellus]
MSSASLGPQAPGPQTPGPQSVDRALEILDAVAEAGGPVGAKVLARRLGCSLSTVYHLLGPLTARGYLVRAEGGGYAPGPGVAVLHRAFRRRVGAGPGVGGVLARLRRESGAEAYFSAYRDGRITVVDSTAPVTDTAHPFVPGPEVRAHATAHGKVLLAGLSRGGRRRFLAEHGMARFTDRTITGAEPLEAELARVRGRGFAVSVGEADPAYTCVAMAVPGGDGEARHALSVSLPTAEFRHRYGRVRAAVAGAVAAFHDGAGIPGA